MTANVRRPPGPGKGSEPFVSFLSAEPLSAGTNDLVRDMKEALSFETDLFGFKPDPKRRKYLESDAFAAELAKVLPRLESAAPVQTEPPSDDAGAGELAKILPRINFSPLRRRETDAALRQVFRVLCGYTDRPVGELVDMAFAVARFALRVAAEGEPPMSEPPVDRPPLGPLLTAEQRLDALNAHRWIGWRLIRQTHKAIGLARRDEPERTEIQRAVVAELLARFDPKAPDADVLMKLRKVDNAFAKVTAEQLLRVAQESRSAVRRAAMLSIACGALGDVPLEKETRQKAVNRIAGRFYQAWKRPAPRKGRG